MLRRLDADGVRYFRAIQCACIETRPGASDALAIGEGCA
jgi:hypothetical protein